MKNKESKQVDDASLTVISGTGNFSYTSEAARSMGIPNPEGKDYVEIKPSGIPNPLMKFIWEQFEF